MRPWFTGTIEWFACIRSDVWRIVAEISRQQIHLQSYYQLYRMYAQMATLRNQNTIRTLSSTKRRYRVCWDHPQSELRAGKANRKSDLEIFLKTLTANSWMVNTVMWSAENQKRTFSFRRVFSLRNLISWKHFPLEDSACSRIWSVTQWYRQNLWQWSGERWSAEYSRLSSQQWK